jgi:hypothetical protein
MQTAQLLDDEEQEEADRTRRIQEVLPVLREAPAAQRDALIGIRRRLTAVVAAR